MYASVMTSSTTCKCSIAQLNISNASFAFVMACHVPVSSQFQKQCSAALCLIHLKSSHLAKSLRTLPAETTKAPQPHTFDVAQGYSALRILRDPCHHYIAGKRLHLSQSVGLLQSDFARLLDPSIHLFCMFVRQSVDLFSEHLDESFVDGSARNQWECIATLSYGPFFMVYSSSIYCAERAMLPFVSCDFHDRDGRVRMNLPV